MLSPSANATLPGLNPIIWNVMQKTKTKARSLVLKLFLLFSLIFLPFLFLYCICGKRQFATIDYLYNKSIKIEIPFHFFYRYSLFITEFACLKSKSFQKTDRLWFCKVSLNLQYFFKKAGPYSGRSAPKLPCPLVCICSLRAVRQTARPLRQAG